MSPRSIATSILATLLAAASIQALPLQDRGYPSFPDSFLSNSGLQNISLVPSTGGNAICVVGNVPVSLTATNVDFNPGDLSNQTLVTNVVAELIQINTTFPSQAIQGPLNVSGTFNINAAICYPLNWDKTSSSNTIHFLTHGIAFDKSYWDFPGYSYVDAAAAAGYATFSYDRLGTGLSDHPDPISVLQAPAHVGIAHSLIQSLRNGTFVGHAFDNIIGIGHSFGSVITNAITADFPADLDAAVLTGFTTDTSSMGYVLAGFNPAIASENQPSRFSELPSGYLVTDTIISNQMTFLRAPTFDPKVLEQADASKQTYTFGELLTQGVVIRPATSFEGPVDVVNGENDFIFCQSNCNLPSDQSVLTLKALYPAASNGSQTVIIPATGHGMNLHYTAPQTYQQILDFVTANGF